MVATGGKIVKRPSAQSIPGTVNLVMRVRENAQQHEWISRNASRSTARSMTAPAATPPRERRAGASNAPRDPLPPIRDRLVRRYRRAVEAPRCYQDDEYRSGCHRSDEVAPV